MGRAIRRCSSTFILRRESLGNRIGPSRSNFVSAEIEWRAIFLRVPEGAARLLDLGMGLGSQNLAGAFWRSMMKAKQKLRVRGWYLVGGLAALVLVSLALTSGGALARIPGGGTERPSTPSAPHAAFTPGNLVIYRVGIAGTGVLTNTGNPVFLDEYTTSGALVQSIPVPTVTS